LGPDFNCESVGPSSPQSYFKWLGKQKFSDRMRCVATVNFDGPKCDVQSEGSSMRAAFCLLVDAACENSSLFAPHFPALLQNACGVYKGSLESKKLMLYVAFTLKLPRLLQRHALLEDPKCFDVSTAELIEWLKQSRMDLADLWKEEALGWAFTSPSFSLCSTSVSLFRALATNKSGSEKKCFVMMFRMLCSIHMSLSCRVFTKTALITSVSHDLFPFLKSSCGSGTEEHFNDVKVLFSLGFALLHLHQVQCFLQGSLLLRSLLSSSGQRTALQSFLLSVDLPFFSPSFPLLSASSATTPDARAESIQQVLFKGLTHPDTFIPVLDLMLDFSTLLYPPESSSLSSRNLPATEPKQVGKFSALFGSCIVAALVASVAAVCEIASCTQQSEEESGNMLVFQETSKQCHRLAEILAHSKEDSQNLKDCKDLSVIFLQLTKWLDIALHPDEKQTLQSREEWSSSCTHSFSVRLLQFQPFAESQQAVVLQQAEVLLCEASELLVCAFPRCVSQLVIQRCLEVAVQSSFGLDYRCVQLGMCAALLRTACKPGSFRVAIGQFPGSFKATIVHFAQAAYLVKLFYFSPTVDNSGIGKWIKCSLERIMQLLVQSTTQQAPTDLFDFIKPNPSPTSGTDQSKLSSSFFRPSATESYDTTSKSVFEWHNVSSQSFQMPAFSGKSPQISVISQDPQMGHKLCLWHIEEFAFRFLQPGQPREKQENNPFDDDSNSDQSKPAIQAAYDAAITAISSTPCKALTAASPSSTPLVGDAEFKIAYTPVRSDVANPETPRNLFQLHQDSQQDLTRPEVSQVSLVSGATPSTKPFAQNTSSNPFAESDDSGTNPFAGESGTTNPFAVDLKEDHTPASQRAAREKEKADKHNAKKLHAEQILQQKRAEVALKKKEAERRYNERLEAVLARSKQESSHVGELPNQGKSKKALRAKSVAVQSKQVARIGGVGSKLEGLLSKGAADSEGSSTHGNKVSSGMDSPTSNAEPAASLRRASVASAIPRRRPTKKEFKTAM